jgi:hypothetical protein
VAGPAQPAGIAMPAQAPAAAPAACRPYDMADEAAVLKPAAGATPAGSWAGQCLDWLLCAYTYPVSMQRLPFFLARTGCCALTSLVLHERVSTLGLAS